MKTIKEKYNFKKKKIFVLGGSGLIGNEVCKELDYILSDNGQKRMKIDYESLRSVLGNGGASEKTASLIYNALK